MRRFVSALNALAAVALFGSTIGTKPAFAEELTTVYEGGKPVILAHVNGHYSSSISLRDVETTILDNGTRAEIWKIQGRSGQCLEITMRSAQLDSFVGLYYGDLRKQDGIDKVAEDDDGAGSLDARLRVTLMASGSYYVAATSVDGQAQGAYLLNIDTCPAFSPTGPAGNGPNPFWPVSTPATR